MIKQKTGHIITMSSVMGLVGAAQMCKYLSFSLRDHILLNLHIADYSASKASLISLHESLRYELDKRFVPTSCYLSFVPANTLLIATKPPKSVQPSSSRATSKLLFSLVSPYLPVASINSSSLLFLPLLWSKVLYRLWTSSIRGRFIYRFIRTLQGF